uniref:Uncharacterized protein n=1 Tax=Oryza brachyantha TaxID=4533 RepID=J3LFP8_ORYBR
MLSSETLVFTRARNTFSPMLSTSAMHRPRLSRRSNAAFRSLSSGSTVTSGWGCAAAEEEEVVEEEASASACCLLADRRFARDIQRIRSATHHMRSGNGLVVMMWCLGVADGVVNLAGEGIQQGVAATSTRAVAAAMERDDTPEKTAAEAEATAACTCVGFGALNFLAFRDGRSRDGAWR